MESVRAEVPSTWKRTGVSNHGRAVLPGTPARGRFAGAVHGAPVSAGEALLRADPREAGGYPSLALQRLRIGFLRSRVWEEVAVGLRWQVGPAAKGEGT